MHGKDQPGKVANPLDSKGQDQPGKVANPSRGQLNRENEIIPG